MRYCVSSRKKRGSKKEDYLSAIMANHDPSQPTPLTPGRQKDMFFFEAGLVKLHENGTITCVHDDVPDHEGGQMSSMRLDRCVKHVLDGCLYSSDAEKDAVAARYPTYASRTKYQHTKDAFAKQISAEQLASKIEVLNEQLETSRENLMQLNNQNNTSTAEMQRAAQDHVVQLNQDNNASKVEMQNAAQEHVVQLNKDNNGSKAEMQESAQAHVVQLNKDNNGSKAEMQKAAQEHVVQLNEESNQSKDKMQGMYGDLILQLNKDSNASKAEMQNAAQEHVVQLNQDNNASKAEMQNAAQAHVVQLNQDNNASKAEMQESAQEHVVQLNKDNNGSKAEMQESNRRANHELLESFENAFKQNNSQFQEQLERVDALVQQATGSSLPIPHVAEIASISVEQNGDEVDASVVKQRFLSSASRVSRSESRGRLKSWCTFNMFKNHNDNMFKKHNGLGHASEIQSINEFANGMLRLSLNEKIKEIPYCALYPESSVGVHGVEVPAPAPVSTEAANSEMVDKGMEVAKTHWAQKCTAIAVKRWAELATNSWCAAFEQLAVPALPEQERRQVVDEYLITNTTSLNWQQLQWSETRAASKQAMQRQELDEIDSLFPQMFPQSEKGIESTDEEDGEEQEVCPPSFCACMWCVGAPSLTSLSAPFGSFNSSSTASFRKSRSGGQR